MYGLVIRTELANSYSACIVIGKRMEALKLYNKLKPLSELVICFEINQTFLQRVRRYA